MRADSGVIMNLLLVKIYSIFYLKHAYQHVRYRTGLFI